MSADKEIDAFLRDQAAELTALRAAVGVPLDLSYESLDRLEDYYRGVLEKSSDLKALKVVNERCARYVGATLAEHTKGTWARSTEPGIPAPSIAVPALKKRNFIAIAPVLNYRRLRIPGLFRDETELWDLPLRRAALQQLVARSKTELASLSKDIGDLAGRVPAKLDGSAKSLELVETTLKAVAGRGVTHARRRQVQQRVILLLGTLIAEAVGKGQWEVVEDPKYSNFGEFRIAGWSPAPIVRAIDAKAPAGTLHEALTSAISTGRTKK